MPKKMCHTFLVYDDEKLPQLLEYLTSVHIMALISPLHNEDRWTKTDIARYIAHQEKRYKVKIDPNAETWERPTGSYIVINGNRQQKTETVAVPKVGDFKKAHRHVVIKYGVSVPVEQVYREFADAGWDILYFEEVRNEFSIIRYLVHMDNPEKFRYKRSEVISLGGFDTKPLFDETKVDKSKTFAALLDYIDKHPKIHDMKYLVRSLCDDGLQDLAQETKSGCYFWNKMLFAPNSRHIKLLESGKDDEGRITFTSATDVDPDEWDITQVEEEPYSSSIS